MSYIDLHCHSTASDGSLSPSQVVQRAKSAGLSAISLTDHDTIAGLDEAAAQAQEAGIDFIPGIEISAEFPFPGTLHILGYGMDIHSPSLTAAATRLIEARNDRNPRIIRKLQELGVAITMEEVLKEANGGVVGRPHIAAILLRKGYVTSTKQAFTKYLAHGGLAYFSKERLKPREAMEMILHSGGLPVLAHPIQLHYENDAQLQRVVKDLLDIGLAGIEVMHSDQEPAMVEKYTKLADRFGLLKTGGSDFHGTSKKDIELGFAHGKRIPRDYFDKLQDRLQAAKNA